MERYEKAIDFLMNKANVAIKYRVLDEICDASDESELQNLKDELINSKRTKDLLEYLKNRKEYHGATLYAVENSLNMLVDMGFGYGKGFFEFDSIIDELSFEIKNKLIDNTHVLGQLPHIVVIPFLIRAGARNEWLVDFVKQRIDTIYDFVVEGKYDIYDDIMKYKRIPLNFQNRAIIRPELYKDGNIKLPLEYDIYGFAYLFMELSLEYQAKINAIISYILDDRFQSIEDGYGILSDTKRYWAMGWDPKMIDLEKDYHCNALLLKGDLLSRFSIAVDTKWFAEALNVMQKYADKNNIYIYPKNFLVEKDSCWILGNHMGLGENRRHKDALTIEGTFRTLKILKNLQKNF